MRISDWSSDVCSSDLEPPFPGDLAIEERIASINRWNALAMVVRANQAHGELGGHIASYASAADLFEVGFNHFFRASDDGAAGDLVYLQPHSAPGVYARSEEHTSELQSLMRISYAVVCLKK